jgi:hypothetical protein
MQNFIKQILPVVACVMLLFGIWLIVYANGDSPTPNDIPATPTVPAKPEPEKHKPGAEPGEQGSTEPPAPPVPAADNSLKAPVADAPCTENECPCKKPEQPVGDVKKQYTPVPWTPVPGLPDPTPPEASAGGDQTTGDQTQTVIRVRRKFRRQ